jgi:hypothetical protein
MSPLIPTDPSLVVPSLDRSNAALPAVLLGYVLLTLLLLARSVRRSWLRERASETPPDRTADEPEPDADHESDDPLERREEASP